MKTQLFIACIVLVIVVMAGSVIALAQNMKKVNINVATLDELQTLSGIEPEIAQAIIDGRPYEKVEDLLQVQGIDEEKLKKIQNMITVKPLIISLATLDELKALPGIEPEIAQTIIDGRPYEKVEDLLRVEGIDEEKLEQIRNLIQMRMNINSATLNELKTLPGIGPQLARAIIEGGPYEEVDELLGIRGIGEKRLAKIRDLIEAKPVGKRVGERGRKLPPIPSTR